MRDTPSSQNPAAPTPTHDPLTGALARALLEPHLHAATAHARRTDSACVLCLFDIDHFKIINDAYGHPRGDQILRDLVHTIQQAIRSSDLLFRYGGDEFVLLLPHTTRDAALAVCQRIFDTLRAARFAGTPPIKLSISMGVASFPADAEDSAQLLAVADHRNYIAKHQGRGRFVSADILDKPTLRSSHQERLIEREEGLDTLHDFLDALASARRGVLTIRGARGTGRSRFLAYAAQIAQMLNYAVLPLAPQPALQRRPYAVLTAAGWGSAPPFLDGAAALDRALQRQIAPEGHDGLLITIDDHAWLDRATAELLQHLLQTSALPRLALAMTERDTDPAGRWADAAPLQRQVLLRPFSEAGLQVWLRGLLHWESPAPLQRWLYQQTKGVPAQVQQLLDALVEQSLLQPDGDGWALHPGYPTVGLPPASPARAVPHNLPAPLTDFVGRAKVCWEIDRLLETQRLVTLVGPGGIGKTRLALETAAARLALYPDGVWFVALESVRMPELVAPTIAKALDIKEVSGPPIVERLRVHLRHKALLLVLDNFEQVLGAAPLLAELLQEEPRLRIMVTSRERLHLPGERVFAVPPLELPNLSAAAPPEALGQNEAVALFVSRAQAARYGLAPTGAAARAVAELCVRLEGLPLAIELAAVRSDRFAPAELLRQLGHRLTTLTDGPRNLSDRQRTLRNTIAWSYSLLTPTEQTLFARLGVFSDGFALDMAERICADGAAPTLPACTVAGGPALAATVESLAHKSLLRDQAQTGGLRFSMLETIREYAVELLNRSGAARETRRRHATCYQELVEQAAPELTGPQQRRWLDQLEQESGNLRAALGWLLEQGAALPALRFVAAVWKFWQFRGYHSEGRGWIERALAQARAHTAGAQERDGGAALRRAIDRARAQALYGLGWLANDQGDYATGASAFTESLATAEALDDQRGMGLALQGIGDIALLRGEHQRARACFERSRALFEALADREEVAWAINHLGRAARYVGDFSTAASYHAESLAHFEALGHDWGTAIALNYLAEAMLDAGDLARAQALLGPWVAQRDRQRGAQGAVIFTIALLFLGRAELHLGHLERAQALLEECLSLSVAAGYQSRVAATYSDLGRLALARGQVAEARRSFQRSLSLQQELQEVAAVQNTLTAAAALAAATEQFESATRLCAAADALRASSRTLLAPLYQPEYQRLQDAISAHLAPEAVARLRAAGSAMTLDHALAFALAALA